MSRWKSILSLVCLAIWLPAISHCKLETAFEFLTCCSHEENSVPHQDNDCQTDVCAVVESGFYKIRDNGPMVTPLAPVLMVLLEIPPVQTPAQTVDLRATVPPELPRTWQFCFRAAAPPRAPSFSS